MIQSHCKAASVGGLFHSSSTTILPASKAGTFDIGQLPSHYFLFAFISARSLSHGGARASIECDANPVFFAPNNPALPGHLIGVNDQMKFVGNFPFTFSIASDDKDAGAAFNRSVGAEFRRFLKEIPKRSAALRTASGDRLISLAISSGDFEEEVSSTKRRSSLKDQPPAFLFRAIETMPFRASPSAPARIFLNETYCGRWLVACYQDHPIVCRCCNPCPKSRGRKERLAMPRRFASDFPFALIPAQAARQSQACAPGGGLRKRCASAAQQSRWWSRPVPEPEAAPLREKSKVGLQRGAGRSFPYQLKKAKAALNNISSGVAM
jgi:hypothetical protein